MWTWKYRQKSWMISPKTLPIIWYQKIQLMLSQSIGQKTTKIVEMMLLILLKATANIINLMILIPMLQKVVGRRKPPCRVLMMFIKGPLCQFPSTWLLLIHFNKNDSGLRVSYFSFWKTGWFMWQIAFINTKSQSVDDSNSFDDEIVVLFCKI